MYMTPAERQSPPSPNRALAMRSPFVRLRELLGDMPPGQTAISLAVGEPQHGVPSFVGPVLASSLDEFGKYPMNKGPPRPGSGADSRCPARSIRRPKC
jgi:hypothetical protein